MVLLSILRILCECAKRELVAAADGKLPCCSCSPFSPGGSARRLAALFRANFKKYSADGGHDYSAYGPSE